MDVADMDELARLFLTANATSDERSVMVAAVQRVDRLDEATGQARSVLGELRRRAATRR
jgi:hypothetical protein